MGIEPQKQTNGAGVGAFLKKIFQKTTPEESFKQRVMEENKMQNLNDQKSGQETVQKYPGEKYDRHHLISQLHHKEHELTAVRTRLAYTEKDLAQITEKWKLASAQIQNDTSVLHSKNNEIEILQARLNALENECANFKQIALKAHETVVSLTNFGEKTEIEKISRITKLLDEEGTKYNDLLSRFDEISSKVRELEHQNTALKIDLETTLRENKDFKEKYDNLEETRIKELANWNEQLRLRETDFSKKLDQVIEQERERYHEVIKDKHDINIVLKQKETELEDTKHALRFLKEEYEKLSEHEKSLQERYSHEMASENSLLDEARKNIDLRDEQIRELSSVVSLLKTESEKIRRDSEARDRIEISQARETKDAEESKLRLREAQENLRKKEHQIFEISKQLENLKLEKMDWLEKEKRLKDDFNLKPYKSILRETKDKLMEKDKMISSLKHKLENLHAGYENLKKHQKESRKEFKYQPPGELQELVSGIAHQVSNSISIIKSHSEFCLETSKDLSLKESMDIIQKNAVGLQKKVEEILDFTKPIVLQCRSFFLEDVMRNAINFVSKKCEIKNIKINVVKEEDIKPIKIDYVRMQDAFYQIILNAIEAMPKGGELKIELLRDGASNKQMVKISDTGLGIEPRNLSVVSQPFFTTKVNKVGLGLSMAKNIVQAHSGHIKITSELGKGTTVECSLPEK
jgi:nitrogen-specific signal transduction histidine kinase